MTLDRKIMHLTFSHKNAKLNKLAKLTGKKVYSFNLLAGYTCPFAKDCKSRVIRKNGKSKIEDGKETKFRCYAASREALFPNLYNSHKKNTLVVKLSKEEIIKELKNNLPKRAQIVRIHASGDFCSQKYFDAWLRVAKDNKNVIFYTYTKALPYWIKRIKEIPPNFILTASKGGKYDELIKKYNLRYAEVVYSKQEAIKKRLPIEENEVIITNPQLSYLNVALLIHGPQPANTKAMKAVYQLRKKKNDK